jgi:hypothetical protein
MPLGNENLELSAGNSANFQVHLVQQSLNIYEHKLRLVYGLGIDINNYRFSKNVDLDPNSDPLSSSIGATNYRKNKLVTKFATIPLMLDLSLGHNGQGFQIAAGPNFGYRIGSVQKQKWNDNGRQKNKVKDDFNLEEFRIGYEVQLGYGPFMFFGRYFPQSIFKDNSGPDLRTVSAGIVMGNI